MLLSVGQTKTRIFFMLLSGKEQALNETSSSAPSGQVLNYPSSVLMSNCLKCPRISNAQVPQVP